MSAFEVALGAQLRVPRKQRLGVGEGRTLQAPRPTVLWPVESLYFGEEQGRCVSTLLPESLFKDRRGFSSRISSPSTLGRPPPLGQVHARFYSQSRSLPALLVIPAAASFAHRLPLRQEWVSDNVRHKCFKRLSARRIKLRLITGGAEGEVPRTTAPAVAGRPPPAGCFASALAC